MEASDGCGVGDTEGVTRSGLTKGGISVRTRIVAAITVVAALGLAAVGVAVYLVERQDTLEQIDTRLMANLESARFIVADGDIDGTPWVTSKEALRAVVERMSPDDNTGVMGMENGVITLVPGVMLDVDLRNEAAFATFVAEQVVDGEPVIGTYAENGVIWRYLAAPIALAPPPAAEGTDDTASPAPDPDVGADTSDPAPQSPNTFVMIYDVQAELAEFNRTAVTFLIVSGLVLVVVAATGALVATRLLRPLRDMRETATRVSARSLRERIPVVGRDDVADLAATMNAMLDRLDDAVESQRSLLSDVGHELKTPLTIVQGHVEVMDPQDPEDTVETRDLILDELDRMARLVQDLSDAAALHGPRPILPAAVDLAELLSQIGKKAEKIVGADVVSVDAGEGTAVLDAPRVTQAMLQLAQNAVTHGGGRLEIGGRAEPGQVVLWVRDFGPGVAPEDRDRVFERFERGTGASRPGSGLGLNIVQVIARAHDGTVDVRDADGGGALFTVRIPDVAAAQKEG